MDLVCIVVAELVDNLSYSVMVGCLQTFADEALESVNRQYQTKAK
jgi:hypothetical protein